MSNWNPTASIETLKARAKIMARVREFFAERDILEVETPLLSRYGVTDRFMKSFKVNDYMGSEGYLQTSPEYAMKRLLAAGSGSIYQICKTFRQDEFGSRHNPEFTMLEWYVEGYDHHQLMTQVFDLMDTLSEKELTPVKLSYQEAFEQYLQIDPLTIENSKLSKLSHELLGELPEDLERDDYLALLFEDQIEPKLGLGQEVCFIHGYPASQAALAKLDPSDPRTACRFEVYWHGVELANGFYELTDPAEQYERFKKDNACRQQDGKPLMSIDSNFIVALEQGLPECSGVALGVDRLVMILLELPEIKDVLTFPSDRA
ncbi:EF-P lysine aminoacylase EpmA [Kangiella spongicola]|uniref:Elongation factor P lysine(34) lysyltransferase n=1 Tax=Kangiella spongicola TaxID=796379 RepID=A0A318D4L6_9GAMM|nr:EF-P lysine aminoacylase EpmA [Kangiella spongicola]PXF63783.1 elongation factor P lysine(34) lysyltransferase [Kangiella spongicola]